jgi:hypothetical protein
VDQEAVVGEPDQVALVQSAGAAEAELDRGDDRRRARQRRRVRRLGDGERDQRRPPVADTSAT